MGENTWVNDWSKLLPKIDQRVIQFNESRVDSAECFDGLHLDIEPQGLDEWKNNKLTVVEKRQLFKNLEKIFKEVRTLLNTSGYTDLPLTAALPRWLDNVGNAPNRKFYWANDKERNDWFNDIAKHLNGITIMAFCEKSLTNVQQSVAWETNNFPGEIRIALNAYHLKNSGEECETWNTVQDMLDVANGIVEKSWRPVDIQSFSRMIEELGIGP